MQEILTALAETSLLEWSAVVTTAICIILAGRNNVHTWWTGIVGCILYGILFYQNKLYADATLQVFFVATSVIGWMHWARANTADNSAPTSASPLYMLMSLSLGGLATCAYGALLHNFTDAYAPFIDSFVLFASVIAQLMLMRRNIQTWPMWLLVNTVSVPLYFSRGLYPSAILYVVCWFNAFYGWYNWHKEMKAAK